MDIKKEVSEKIQKIVKKEGDIGEHIVDFVHEDYAKRLKDSEKAGRTSKQATQQILSGIAAGLKAGGHQVEDFVVMAAEAIVDISSDIASQTLGTFTSYAEDAGHLLDVEASDTAEGRADKSKQEEVVQAFEGLQDKIAQEKMRHAQVLEGISAHAEDALQSHSEASQGRLNAVVNNGAESWEALEEKSTLVLTKSRHDFDEWLKLKGEK